MPNVRPARWFLWVSDQSRRARHVCDLSQTPIYVLIEDPPESRRTDEPPFEVEVDDWRFFAEYYSPVVELLEVRGPSPSHEASVNAAAEGAWLPGGAVWLGLARELLETARSTGEWEEAARQLDRNWVDIDETRAGVHASDDGHVVVLAREALELLE